VERVTIINTPRSVNGTFASKCRRSVSCVMPVFQFYFQAIVKNNSRGFTLPAALCLIYRLGISLANRAVFSA
jgi:hypothetical protein